MADDHPQKMEHPSHGCSTISTISTLTGHDVVTIAAIEHEELAGFPWSYSDFITQLASGAIGWAIRQEGKIVAYALMDFAAERARLMKLVVVRTHRHRGLAHELFATAQSTAAQRDCRTLMLEVAASNTAAITFYRQHGMRVVEQLPDYYRNQHCSETGLVMEKELECHAVDGANRGGPNASSYF